MHFQAPATCWSSYYKKILALEQALQLQALWALAWALGLVQDPMKGGAPQPALLVSAPSSTSQSRTEMGRWEGKP